MSLIYIYVSQHGTAETAGTGALFGATLFSVGDRRIFWSSDDPTYTLLTAQCVVSGVGVSMNAGAPGKVGDIVVVGDSQWELFAPTSWDTALPYVTTQTNVYVVAPNISHLLIDAVAIPSNMLLGTLPSHTYTLMVPDGKPIYLNPMARHRRSGTFTLTLPMVYPGNGASKFVSRTLVSRSTGVGNLLEYATSSSDPAPRALYSVYDAPTDLGTTLIVYGAFVNVVGPGETVGLYADRDTVDSSYYLPTLYNQQADQPEISDITLTNYMPYTGGYTHGDSKFEQYNWQGRRCRLEANQDVYRVGGATINGIPTSMAILSTSCSPAAPAELYQKSIALYNTLTGNRTITIECFTENPRPLTNLDAWIEVLYYSSATAISYTTSMHPNSCLPKAVGTALSATSATWVHPFQTGQAFKLTLTISIGREGIVFARPVLAGEYLSTTPLYFCPDISIA
jgi:hypothetical protein